jgi:hypothetical protein
MFVNLYVYFIFLYIKFLIIRLLNKLKMSEENKNYKSFQSKLFM